MEVNFSELKMRKIRDRPRFSVSGERSPSFDTILKVVRALGLKSQSKRGQVKGVR
jgi:DNA-binding phage protein